MDKTNKSPYRERELKYKDAYKNMSKTDVRESFGIITKRFCIIPFTESSSDDNKKYVKCEVCGKEEEEEEDLLSRCRHCNRVCQFLCGCMDFGCKNMRCKNEGKYCKDCQGRYRNNEGRCISCGTNDADAEILNETFLEDVD